MITHADPNVTIIGDSCISKTTPVAELLKVSKREFAIIHRAPEAMLTELKTIHIAPLVPMAEQSLRAHPPGPLKSIIDEEK